MNTLIGLLIIVIVGLGAVFGYVVSTLPKTVAMFTSGAGAFFVLFFGMVLYAYHAREERKKFEKEITDSLDGVKAKASNLFAEQERTYTKLIGDLVQATAYRVAVVIVKDMIHGLNNDEQRDAALTQAKEIVDKEIRQMKVEKIIEEVGKGG
jgi:hypothetical protein